MNNEMAKLLLSILAISMLELELMKNSVVKGIED